MCVFSVYSTLFNLIPIFALPKYLVVVFYPCIFLWLSINPPNCQRLRFSPTITVLIYVLTFIYHSIHFGTLTFLYSLLNVSVLYNKYECSYIPYNSLSVFLLSFIISTTAISMQPLFRFLTLTENNKPNNRYTI